VVNAAGLYSDKISGFLGINDFTMHPRRGQFHIIDRAAPLKVKHIILPVPTKITKGKLLTPTVHGNWLAGPTAEELEDKTDTGTNRDGLEEVVAGVRKLVPSLRPRDAITQYAGLRPVRTPDGYHIRNFEQLPGYLEISGIRSTGITASPALAKYLAQRLTEMGLEMNPKNEFKTQRQGIPCFRESDDATREKLILANPKFGKVICRCETVTEAEIVEAIHRQPGARDMDGIKRRVRAGLGRCQGGFCGTRIPEILARELGIPITEVTKNGKGSELLIGTTKSLKNS
jgi:glycerol-3-phosphate dehydrogenase